MSKGSWAGTGSSAEIIAVDENREYLTIQLTNSITTALGIGEAAVAGEGVQLLVAGNSVTLVGHQARSAIYAIGNTATGTWQSNELILSSIKPVLSSPEIRGAAGAAGILTLSTAELTVVDGDILGRVDFQAPLESSGSDAILVTASIYAEADATFSATVNSTELVFATATDGAVVERMRITSGGYIMLGSDAPSIKMKKLTGTSAVSGSSVTVAHGLDKAKIIGVQVLITNNSGNRIPPEFTSVGSHEFEFFIDGDNIRIYSISGNSASIDENAFTVLITYEE